jgi:hypothetical protein
MLHSKLASLELLFELSFVAEVEGFGSEPLLSVLEVEDITT